MRATYVETISAAENQGHEQEHADVALVRACVRGERPAMEQLYRSFHRRVFGVVVRMVGQSDAEEVTQDVFIRLFRGLNSFSHRAALSTWVYRLAMNHCLTYLSKRNRRARLDDRYDREQVHVRSTEVQASPFLRIQLERALHSLPDGYRAVLVLHDVEGLNHKEIASILDCREGTSKSQLHKARMKMRTLLGAGSEEAK